MIPGGRKGKRVPLFFTVGWLFAELLLGIAMVFLISSPGAIKPPPPTPTPVTPTVPPPTPTLHPYLSTSPVTVVVSGVDVNGLINNDAAAIRRFQNLVITQLKSAKFQKQPLIGQCAGLVIPYGGEPTIGGNSIPIGGAMTRALRSLAVDSSKHGQFFKLAVYHDPLIWVGQPYGKVKLELYVFNGSASCQA